MQENLTLDNADILISIRQRYFNSIASGDKSVELRRRAPKIQEGTRIWLYCTSPNATILAVCTLQKIATLPNEDLWDQFGLGIAITRFEFDDYLQGLDSATALVIKDVELLSRPMHLDAIRSLKKNFQPPQFYMNLLSDCPLRNKLQLEL